MSSMRDVIQTTTESSLAIVKYVDMLNPGGQAVAELQYYDHLGELQGSGQRRYVQDQFFHNFFLPDEQGYVRFDNELGMFVTVGTWGLFREVKPDALILQGSSGTCTIWEGSPMAATTHQITVHHDWINSIGDVASGTESLAAYRPTSKVWRFWDYDCPVS